MDGIHIQEISGPGVGERDVEIVERKGLGHPDTICDALMERISQALSRAYLDRFGAILHHNCDKGLLVAGQVERRFGGGRVKEPMRLVIGDRATTSVGKENLDVASIAVESAKSWFRENFPRINPDRDLLYSDGHVLRTRFGDKLRPYGHDYLERDGGCDDPQFLRHGHGVYRE